MTTAATGRCQCSAIRYRLTAEPLFTYACHCGSCQKRTGSAFSMGLVVLTDSLQVEGELTAWSRVSDKGATNTRYSCAECGNIIYGIGDSAPTFAKLQAGTLDNTRAVRPEVHIWTQNKQAWLTLPARVPQFATQPDELSALLQPALDYRAGG